MSRVLVLCGFSDASIRYCAAKRAEGCPLCFPVTMPTVLQFLLLLGSQSQPFRELCD